MNEKKKKIILLSNITVDLIVAKLHKKYEFYVPDGFDTWIQEIINPVSGLYSKCFDAVVVLLDGTEARSWKNNNEAKERIRLWQQTLSILVNQITSIPIFVSTIDIRENRIKSLAERKFSIELQNSWYQFIQNKAEEKNNIYIFDIADIISEIGRKQFYSNKMWYMSSMPYSRDGLNAVTTEIERALEAAFGLRKKSLLLI